MRWLASCVVSGWLLVSGCGEGREAGPTAGAVAVRGVQGALAYSAGPEGKKGAWARFELASKESAGARLKSTAGAEGASELVEVHVQDERHAELTFHGVTLDGDGALTGREEETLRALLATGELSALAMAPLELGCTEGELEPRVLAALLFPWQLAQKYLVANREGQTTELVSTTSCRYYTRVDGPADARSGPQYPLLSNGQVVARAFGYLPLDEHGALAGAAQAKALSPDQDVYGPGNSMCRGACGADCEENNCGKPKEEWRCLKENGRNTGEKQRFEIYTCGEHPGCIEHDGCFDNCKAVFGVDSWDAAFCMRGCDLQAASGYGAGQGLEWAQGYGPYTHEKTYEYSTGDRILDERTCPMDLALTAIPGSGLAPFSATLKWTGDLTDTGAERCRLDLGDGSPLVDIDPCPESGEYTHIYAVPSDMREASGLYTASLTRIGAARTVSAGVQARWHFEGTPETGPAPLLAGFVWAGFSLVEKQLTCTLDFGDGSAPEVIENCAKKAGASHRYAKEGVYVASLKVTGEDRPVTKTVTIVVKKQEQNSQELASVKTWQLVYSIQNDSDYSWSAYGVDTVRNWTEKESGTLVLTRTYRSQDDIVLEGQGTVTSSIDYKKVESSPYFTEERWDKGTGPSTSYVSVTINPQTGMYDVYFGPGDFSAQYGGSRTQVGGDDSSYGPSDEETHVEPAPILATGELTRMLPAGSLTISGSYTWEDYYAYEQAQDPTFDVTEVWKKAHKSGTTKWTLTPLTYD